VCPIYSMATPSRSLDDRLGFGYKQVNPLPLRYRLTTTSVGEAFEVLIDWFGYTTQLRSSCGVIDSLANKIEIEFLSICARCSAGRRVT
jgi:hypothetical protein